MEINYKKINKEAKTPYKKYDIDAGFDLTAVWKKETDKYIEYGTGLAFEIPEGYVGFLFPRSSVTKEDLMLKNAVGVVDATYRGEIRFRYTNVVHDLYDKEDNNDSIRFKNILVREFEEYEVGDRCGQIIIMELPKVKLIETNELSETIRGTAGYGSSGKN